MGKTEKGTLWVARDKTTPYHFYQYFYNIDDADTEMLLKDMVDLSVKEQERKKKRYNWIIAITVAVLYLTVSLLTGKWQWTWIIWFVYCFYRVLTEYVMKRSVG